MSRCKLVLAALVAALVIGVSWPLARAKSEMAAAGDFTRHCTSLEHFQGHTPFLSVVGEKKPSDWLRFFLSAAGSGCWVTRREIDEIGGHGAVFTCPFAPDNVVIISGVDLKNTASDDPRTRFSTNTMLAIRNPGVPFLAVYPDDARSRVRVEGYEGWKLVYEDEWDFPVLAPVR